MLEADFGLRAFVAEEKDVFVRDERWEVLGMLQLGGEVGLVVAYPTGPFGHYVSCNIRRRVVSRTRRKDYDTECE